MKSNVTKSTQLNIIVQFHNDVHSQHKSVHYDSTKAWLGEQPRNRES